MIPNIRPEYVVLNGSFREFKHGDTIVSRLDKGVVIVVYDEMRTYYVKRSNNLQEYLDGKITDLKNQTARLPKGLAAINAKAKLLNQTPRIYYMDYQGGMDYYKVLEMFAVSGFYQLMSRVTPQKGAGHYIYRAELNIGLVVHLSSTVELEQNALVERFNSIVKKRVAREYRYNTAAWIRMINLHPGVPYYDIANRIVVNKCERCTKPPYTPTENNIRDVNERATVLWGNETVPRTYLQMMQAKQNFDRTGRV